VSVLRVENLVLKVSKNSESQTNPNMSFIIGVMKWKAAVPIILLLVIAGVITFWQLTPRVEGFSPAESALLGRQPLKILFSQAMDKTSVESHFSLDPPLSGETHWNDTLDEVSFIPNNSWPSGESIKVFLKSGARSHKKLPLLENNTWSITVGPTQLAYLWPADDKSNLYLVNPETGDFQTITSEESGILDFTVSPDGLTILYSLVKKGGESSIVLLDRVTGTVSPAVKCSSGVCRSPRISPDGSLLAYEYLPREAGVQPGIQIFDLETNTHTPLGNSEEYLDNPLWSPSGWISFYNHTQQRFEFWNPYTSEGLSFPNETGGDGTWSTDGRYFVYTEIPFVSETLAPRHLLMYDLLENQQVDLSTGNFFEHLNPSFSPQGLILAYGRKSLDPDEWSPGRQLWIMDINEGISSGLTSAGDYHHSSFSWHPEGDQLAYVRYNQATLSDPPEIWVINRDGTNSLRLIINGFSPTWIP